MNPEYVIIILLLSIIGLLSQILHYMKLIWNNSFDINSKLSDMHRVIVGKR